jgi:hypothetical protein
MKYLILYIFIVFTIYVYLKYYCYTDQINILNISSQLDNSSNIKLNESIQQNRVETYKHLPHVTLYNYNKNYNYEDDYHAPFKTQNIDKKEFFSPTLTIRENENVKWKGFGTDISSKYVQQKKSEFREISTPNITIEKYRNGQFHPNNYSKRETFKRIFKK